MSYMVYDFSKIKAEGTFTFRVMDPLNPNDLVPLDMDVPSAGKKYDQSSILSTVMTQLSRYSKKRNLNTSREWLVMKERLSNLFKKRWFKSKIKLLDNEILAKHINPVVEKLVKNGGVFQDLNFTLRPLSETYTIHFFLKDITKVVLSKTLDADKCGQGISAWSKTMNALFCPLFRAIEECFTKSLKDHVIYENGITETQFDYKVASLFDNKKEIFTNDFKEYDSKQNADTQFLEDIVLEMFCPKELTQIYRQMRLKSKQKSPFVTLMNECLKNSGESATLFTNTILNMFYIALTTEVVDVQLEGVKGDDSIINAAIIKLVNQVVKMSPDAHLPMQSDIDFPLHGDFVGYYLSELGLIPDLLKILGKFMSKDFEKNKNKKIEIWERERLGVSSLSYFEQVQAAMRDRLKFLNEEKLIYLKRIYWDLYGIKEQHFEYIISTYLYCCSSDCRSDDMKYHSALYYSEAGYEHDDLTEADKNKKRVKQTYKETAIAI